MNTQDAPQTLGIPPEFADKLAQGSSLMSALDSLKAGKALDPAAAATMMKMIGLTQAAGGGNGAPSPVASQMAAMGGASPRPMMPPGTPQRAPAPQAAPTRAPLNEVLDVDGQRLHTALARMVSPEAHMGITMEPEGFHVAIYVHDAQGNPQVLCEVKSNPDALGEAVRTLIEQIVQQQQG